MAKIELAFKTPGTVAVVTPGTPVPLSVAELFVASFVVQWAPTNAGNIYIGEADVDSDKCLLLSADSATMGFGAEDSMADEDRIGIDLSKVYIDAPDAGSKVYLSYTVMLDKSYNS